MNTHLLAHIVLALAVTIDYVTLRPPGHGEFASHVRAAERVVATVDAPLNAPSAKDERAAAALANVGAACV